MIRTTHAEITMLRKGSPRPIPIPGRTRPGLDHTICPITLGRTYTLLAPAAGDMKREKVTACAIAVDQDGTDWMVTFRYGVALEVPRLLKARPGGDDGDYTTEPFRAAQDEPEPVDEQTLKRQTKDARTAERVRLDAETRGSRDQLRHAIDDLASRHDIGEPAARRLANMRRELQRLERELAA